MRHAHHPDPSASHMHLKRDIAATRDEVEQVLGAAVNRVAHPVRTLRSKLSGGASKLALLRVGIKLVRRHPVACVVVGAMLLVVVSAYGSRRPLNG